MLSYMLVLLVGSVDFMAVTYARELAQAHPRNARNGGTIGSAYLGLFELTNAPKDAAAAMAGYNNYLQMMSEDDVRRPPVKQLIKSLQLRKKAAEHH